MSWSGRRRTRSLAWIAVVVASLLGPPVGAAQPDGDPASPAEHGFTIRPVEGEVTRSGRTRASALVRSDPDLISSTSAQAVTALVKLDYDPLASYQGDLAGLDATSPTVTGTGLSTESAASQAYLGHVATLEAAFEAQLAGLAPGAVVTNRLRTVYGGLVLRLPANEAKRLLEADGVVAVQADDLRHLGTDSSPGFVGAPAIWDDLGGQASAGHGVIVGVLDSGAWPEHPSFADDGSMPAAPAWPDGRARTCDFGADPGAPGAPGPFECQDKLIAGEPFLDTYNLVHGDDAYPDSARDNVGHGSHTATTAAGAVVATAPLYGVDRGPVSGVAPGAHLAVYKTCGLQGCFPSDIVAAVGEAVLDGVDVINFSVSGGTDPLTDPVSTAFLHAYAAGVLVSAAAGNDGPGAGTVDHAAPWVMTVAASTQLRAFRTVATLSAPSGDTLDLPGASVTAGIATPTPVVAAAAVPGYGDARCDAEAAPGTFAGVVVACERSPGRVRKGYHVALGGAVGMLLYNPVRQDVLTDNHHVPTVHLDAPEGALLLDFLATHGGTAVSFPQGEAVDGAPDVMAAFSGRGPGGMGLKPDIAAPGVQILAANTPVPQDVVATVPGQLYQAIAGTSMAAPHVAGAIALVAAVHPDWTPGQIRSALMTTAHGGVVEEDGASPADPFDAGAGRVDLARATDPGLVLDETLQGFEDRAGDAVDLNLPSVDAPLMPGQVTTRRTFTNVSGSRLPYRVSTEAPPGAAVDVFPSTFTMEPGESRALTIQIEARDLAPGQHFAAITLDQTNGDRDLRIPVAFRSTQAEVSLGLACEPDEVTAVEDTAVCEMTLTNQSLAATRVDVVGAISRELGQRPLPAGVSRPPGFRASDGTIPVATPPGTVVAVAGHVELAGRERPTPTLRPSQDPRIGYLPLPDDFFDPIGDEVEVTVRIPSLVFGERTYDRLSVVSNGYAVLGGAGPEDIAYAPQTLPDPRPPNDVLAPYWTDLDDGPPPAGDSGAPGVGLAVVTDDVLGLAYFVVEWRMFVFDTAELRTFQLWLGLNGTEQIFFVYDPEDLPGPGGPEGLTVGAENDDGTKGSQLDGLPTGDLHVVSIAGAPTVTVPFAITGRAGAVGEDGVVTATMQAPSVPGVAVREERIAIRSPSP